MSLLYVTYRISHKRKMSICTQANRSYPYRGHFKGRESHTMTLHILFIYQFRISILMNPNETEGLSDQDVELENVFPYEYEKSQLPDFKSKQLVELT